MAQFRNLVTTPHVLTEVSNLGDLQDKERLAFRSWLIHTIELAAEYSDESRTVVRGERRVFGRLGLTDAALASLDRHQFLFLTDDLDLYVTLAKRGADAINFDHLRPLNWT